jgi:hypothetical protein
VIHLLLNDSSEFVDIGDALKEAVKAFEQFQII